MLLSRGATQACSQANGREKEKMETVKISIRGKEYEVIPANNGAVVTYFDHCMRFNTPSGVVELPVSSYTTVGG